MCQLHWGLVTGPPSNDPRVLVVEDAEGCRRVCKKVRAMPEACPNYTSISKMFKSHQQFVAFCTIGARHHWLVFPSN